jgi:hypothetical protein
VVQANMVNLAVAVLLECFVLVVMMTQRCAKIVLLDIIKIKKQVRHVYRAFLDERKEKTVRRYVMNVVSTSMLHLRTKHAV